MITRNFDKKSIESIKLNQSVSLRRVTRLEFLARMQVVTVIDDLTERAYSIVEERIWRERSDDSPHGRKWNESFHASQFPTGDKDCPRKAVYQMMDFRSAQPFNRRARTLMTQGKDIEVHLVDLWNKAGLLISAPPDAQHQTGFVYKDAWLTASVDAVLCPQDQPIPVEIKTVSQDALNEMRATGEPYNGDRYLAQLKVQLALVHLNQDKIWPGLKPLTHGYLYYVSRADPTQTIEFRVNLDMQFFKSGISKLISYKGFFGEARIPSSHPDAKHPFKWLWSYPPCKWCDYKKICQQDHRSGNNNLMESAGIERERTFDVDYNPVQVRREVLDRWS